MEGIVAGGIAELIDNIIVFLGLSIFTVVVVVGVCIALILPASACIARAMWERRNEDE